MKVFHDGVSPLNRPIQNRSSAQLEPSDWQKLKTEHRSWCIALSSSAGSRTNWHTHSGAQWLLIVEGRVRVQEWGQPPREVEAGDAVVIAPHEKHWHGAAPGARGVHLAVNVHAQTQWLEPVTDDQYNGALAPL